MTTNANSIRPMKLWDCLASDPQIQGARVTINGVLRHLGMNRVSVLQQFRTDLRDDLGNLQRPMGELNEEQLEYFNSFGIEFEPAALPGWYHPVTCFEIGKFYRQGY